MRFHIAAATVRATGRRKHLSWIPSLLAILTVFLPDAARPLMGEQPRELVESALALYAGHYEQAAALAEKYLKAHPRVAAARVLMARSLLAQENYPQAFEELRQALRSDPANVDALYYFGRVCRMLSQREYQQLFAMAPDSARVHQLMAEMYRLQENTPMAEAEYQAALKANPRSVEILNALGDLKRSQYHFEEAISYYSQAQAISPRDFDSAYGLGASFLFKQELDRAIEYFLRARDLDPKSAVARLALGDALLRAGRTAEAVTELNAAAELEPSMRQAFTLLGRAYHRLGRTREAEKVLQRAEELTRREKEARQELLAGDEFIPAPAGTSPRKDSSETPKE